MTISVPTLLNIFHNISFSNMTQTFPNMTSFTMATPSVAVTLTWYGDVLFRHPVSASEVPGTDAYDVTSVLRFTKGVVLRGMLDFRFVLEDLARRDSTEKEDMCLLWVL